MITIENQMIYLKEEGLVIAYATFPLVEEGVVNINHTFTHPSKRGQGLAKRILDELYIYLKKNNLKALASCSYADVYFKRYPEKQDVLVEKNKEKKWKNLL